MSKVSKILLGDAYVIGYVQLLINLIVIRHPCWSLNYHVQRMMKYDKAFMLASKLSCNFSPSDKMYLSCHVQHDKM